jgi:hypothetical protein
MRRTGTGTSFPPTPRGTLAVGARERKRQGVGDALLQTQAPCHRGGYRTVSAEDRFDGVPAAADDGRGGGGAAERRAAGPGPPQRVEHDRELRRPDVIHAGAERDVVTEEPRHLEGLAGADRRHQRHPVRVGLCLRIEPEVLGEAHRDEARAQHVLHRLAESEVGRQGERGDQLGEPHAGRRRDTRLCESATHGRIPGRGVAAVWRHLGSLSEEAGQTPGPPRPRCTTRSASEERLLGWRGLA